MESNENIILINEKHLGCVEILIKLFSKLIKWNININSNWRVIWESFSEEMKSEMRWRILSTTSSQWVQMLSFQTPDVFMYPGCLFYTWNYFRQLNFINCLSWKAFWFSLDKNWCSGKFSLNITYSAIR